MKAVALVSADQHAIRTRSVRRVRGQDCLHFCQSPQASFSRIMAASSAWKQAVERLWGISCRYRDAQLIQLSSVDVWFAFEKSTTHNFKYCAFLKCIFCICDESFMGLKKLLSLRENQFSAIIFYVVIIWEEKWAGACRMRSWNRDKEQSHQWPQSAVTFLGTVGAERVWCRQRQPHD